MQSPKSKRPMIQSQVFENQAKEVRQRDDSRKQLNLSIEMNPVIANEDNLQYQPMFQSRLHAKEDASSSNGGGASGSAAQSRSALGGGEHVKISEQSTNNAHPALLSENQRKETMEPLQDEQRLDTSPQQARKHQ